jgi:hypothetical protein
LEVALMRIAKLPILAMRLPKRRWRGKLSMKSVFNEQKNLLLKESVMVSSTSEIATNLELAAQKTWKEQKRTYWLPLKLVICL